MAVGRGDIGAGHAVCLCVIEMWIEGETKADGGLSSLHILKLARSYRHSGATLGIPLIAPPKPNVHAITS